jgi:hypothetical protein
LHFSFVRSQISFAASIIFGALYSYLGAGAAFLTSAAISICAAVLLLTIRTKTSSPL